MGRPSRILTFEKTQWVWSHGDGLRRKVDPTNHPLEQRLAKDDCRPITEDVANLIERRWKNLDSNHRLKRYNRIFHAMMAEAPPAGQPAYSSSSSDGTCLPMDDARAGCPVYAGA
eukprot:7781226-Pyramimonas_sp.AAC.1